MNAYKKYKEELVRLSADTISRQAINIENNWYHAVVYLSSSKKNFKAVLWNARTYQDFRLKVSKEFSQPYLKIKEIFADVLLRSLFFVSDQNDHMILRFNYKAIPDKINKAIAMRHDQRRRKSITN